MVYGTEAAVAANAIAQAIKASGVIVHVEPTEFLRILQKGRGLVIVQSTGGIFKKNYQYLTSYKGLAFFAKSSSPLILPSESELIVAGKIWIPG
ncbi:MAG: hypothetical protein NTX22_12305 [Ignavibacteriales bacterium]|nr:hypothetical protein [Ignavibacteriales bacterium]